MKRILAVLFCLASINVLADETQIRRVLGQYFPTLEISSVQPSPIADLYEVLAGEDIFYVDQTGEYLVRGPLFESRTRMNLTQKRLDALHAMKFDSLPFDKAIKVVKGNGARRLALFSDPDCPFSRRLERELSLLDNLTVHVFLNPLTNLHPDAMERAIEIWCSADRTRSWLDYMLQGKEPANPAKCDAPVNDILALSEKIGVYSTPVLVFQNGLRVDGAITAEEIEDLLKKNSSVQPRK